MVPVGLPIREDTEPDSAIFRFVKKNNTELQAIGTALTAVSIRDNNYRGKSHCHSRNGGLNG